MLSIFIFFFLHISLKDTRDLYILSFPIILFGDIIGILGKLKSSFGGGKGDIDSKIDSAFSNPGSSPKLVQQASPSSVSERVLAGHRKFGEQFQSRPAPSESDYGRFSDPESEFGSNPLDLNADIDAREPPRAPEPLQVRSDIAGNRAIRDGETVRRDAFEPKREDTPERYGLEIPRARPTLFPGQNTNIPEKTDYTPEKAVSGSLEQRLIDELEDIRAQNNEILRRIQRLEAKIR